MNVSSIAHLSGLIVAFIVLAGGLSNADDKARVPLQRSLRHGIAA